MKLLLDMNLSPAWVEILESAGHEAIHLSAAGRPQATDEEVLRWAVEEERVVIVNDPCLGMAVAAARAPKPSILHLRTTEVSPQLLRDFLVSVLSRFERELREGAIVTADLARTRARMLPLRHRAR